MVLHHHAPILPAVYCNKRGLVDKNAIQFLDRDAIHTLESQVRSQRQNCGEKVGNAVPVLRCQLLVHRMRVLVLVTGKMTAFCLRLIQTKSVHVVLYRFIPLAALPVRGSSSLDYSV